MKAELKASDLRIGNWVEITEKAAGHAIDTCHVPEGFSMDNRIHQVGGIDSECIDLIVCEEYFEFYPEDIVGVPITEDWLKQFGFVLFESGFKKNLTTDNFIIIEDDMSYGLYDNSNLYQLGCGFTPCLGAEIEHVHQLMNLFHALTGEELTLKED